MITDDNGKQKRCEKLSMLETKDRLRISEMQILVAQRSARDGITSRDVPDIVPQSAEMIALVGIINNPIKPELGYKCLNRCPVDDSACTPGRHIMIPATFFVNRTSVTIPLA